MGVLPTRMGKGMIGTTPVGVGCNGSCATGMDQSMVDVAFMEGCCASCQCSGCCTRGWV